VKTSSRRLKPDSYQTHQHKIDRLTPNSRQTHTALDTTIGATTVSFAFLTASVATVRTSFQFFSHRTNGAFVQLSLTDIGYYIIVTLDQVLCNYMSYTAYVFSTGDAFCFCFHSSLFFVVTSYFPYCNRCDSVFVKTSKIDLRTHALHSQYYIKLHHPRSSNALYDTLVLNYDVYTLRYSTYSEFMMDVSCRLVATLMFSK
jgi:hypothetical protein